MHMCVFVCVSMCVCMHRAKRKNFHFLCLLKVHYMVVKKCRCCETNLIVGIDGYSVFCF